MTAASWVACLQCQCPTPVPIPLNWRCPNCDEGFVKFQWRP